MDFEKQTRMIPSSANSVDQPKEVSLFDAVRKWTRLKTRVHSRLS